MTGFASRALIALALVYGISAACAQTGDVAMHSTRGNFADVKERLVMAIENRGLVLNYTARIGDMLDRTGKDIGSERRVYSKAEVLEFCSAQLSRATMEADPRNIVYCPYAIAVYQVPKEPDKVYISYRKPGVLGSGQSIKSLRAVDRLLAEIVRDVLK
jgi:uncharacterized protein (DUF302 family)